MDYLPEDLCRNITSFLPAPDILACLTLRKSWNEMGKSECFWRDLLLRDDAHSSVQTSTTSLSRLKQLFLIHSHANTLATSGVKWCHSRTSYHMARHPSPREGHLMCGMGDRRVVVTGGFCDDERVHVLNLQQPCSAAAATNKTSSSDGGGQPTKRWNVISPRGRRPTFCYGATLTALDDHRAVQFGGFLAGGYSRESNQVFLLTLGEDCIVRESKWELIVPSGTAPPGRAYHSATLIQNRYLVIIGGMQTNASIANEAILDTLTWTWLDSDTLSAPDASPKPSARHGHSVVLDAARNRLVLFGGGSGADLLRSGVDNTEVWELLFDSDVSITANFEELQGTWNRIHRDVNDDEADDDGESSPLLSPAETLCLGRCHIGVKVARDMVVLAFGSGRPTTNGVLGYNLKEDTFVRPNISGPLPFPRFTAAACMIDGWLMVHGGYSVQESGTKGDTVLLDLAPGLKRKFEALPMMTTDNVVRSQPPVRDEDVSQSQDSMLRDILAASPEERQFVARGMLQRLMLSGQMGGRAAMILTMVANGHGHAVVLGDDEVLEEQFDTESEEDDDDDEYSPDDQMSAGF